MKEIQPLPLDERIRRVKDNYSAYPEYLSRVIRSFAEMPVADYLARFEEAQARLCGLLSLPDCAGLTYRETACRIYQLYRKEPGAAGEAACILAAPMKYYFDYAMGRNNGT